MRKFIYTFCWQFVHSFSLLFALIISLIFGAYMMADKHKTDQRIKSALNYQQALLENLYIKRRFNEFTALISNNQEEDGVYLYYLIDKNGNKLAGNNITQYSNQGIFLYVGVSSFNDGNTLFVINFNQTSKNINKNILLFLGVAILISILLEALNTYFQRNAFL